MKKRWNASLWKRKPREYTWKEVRGPNWLSANSYAEAWDRLAQSAYGDGNPTDMNNDEILRRKGFMP